MLQVDSRAWLSVWSWNGIGGGHVRPVLLLQQLTGRLSRSWAADGIVGVRLLRRPPNWRLPLGPLLGQGWQLVLSLQPLNPNPDSRWNTYFRDNEVLLQIDKDVR